MTRSESEKIACHHLAGKRLEHSISVASLAASMGKVFGLDTEALYIAGVLHDIAKTLEQSKQRELALRWYSRHPDSGWSETPALWHALAAAEILVTEYGFTESEILQAILRHTTGERGMSRFDECLYAADFLDPVRSFEGQASVWPLIKRDFDAGLFEMCRQTIQSVLTRGLKLDTASVGYYNELLERLADPKRLPLALPL